MSERDDEAFSAEERRGLAAWRVSLPSDDFAARVLTRLEAEPAAPRGMRQVAVAALAVMLVGGFFAARMLSGGASTFGEVRPLPGDGGSSVEVSPVSDSVRS